MLRVEAFRPLADFFAEVQGLVERIKSCPPAEGFAEVMLPGENAHRHYMQRVREGLFVDETAWGQIEALAAELSIDLPAAIVSR